MVAMKWWRGFGAAWFAVLAGSNACQSGDSNDESRDEPRSAEPCTSNLDCAEDRPFCDFETRLCTQCTFNECKSDEVCLDGQCEAACTNSRECASDRICDPDLGVCVECARDADCAEDQLCDGSACRTACDSDRDCRALDLLCDTDAGFCVECNNSLDCPKDEHCNAERACQPDHCIPDASYCDGDELIVCEPDGSMFYTLTCPARCTGSATHAGCEEPRPADPPVGQGGFSGSAGSGGFSFGGTGGFAAGGSSGSNGLGGTAGGFVSAGSGGMSGSDGGDGGGGGGNPQCPKASADPGVIDDLEDGDHTIAERVPFQGFWFAFNDGTGSQFPEPDTTGAAPFAPTLDDESGGYAACTTGSGFSSWGAGIGFNLLTLEEGDVCPVDADWLSGVRFLFKSTGEARLDVATQSSTSVEAGGTCSASMGCDVHPWTSIPANGDWTEVSVLWTGLFPGVTPFDPNELLGFQFQTGFDGKPFELCIDDIELF